MIKGIKLFEEGTAIYNELFAAIYDKIEKNAEEQIADIVKNQEGDEPSDEDYDKISMIMDYKFRAQEALENASLLTNKMLYV